MKLIILIAVLTLRNNSYERKNEKRLRIIAKEKKELVQFKINRTIYIKIQHRSFLLDWLEFTNQRDNERVV
jgi:hypothetical protein